MSVLFYATPEAPESDRACLIHLDKVTVFGSHVIPTCAETHPMTGANHNRFTEAKAWPLWMFGSDF